MSVEDTMQRALARHIACVIWPAFVVAACAELVFFAVFDPFELHFFGAPLELSRMAIYTMGFFGFWALGIASSTLTVMLEHLPDGRRADERPSARDEW